jgi:hypothetical protein
MKYETRKSIFEVIVFSLVALIAVPFLFVMEMLFGRKK